MYDLNTEICSCNSLTVNDIANCIKENNLETMEAILENSLCPMGDKCGACKDEGTNGDGLNIPFVLARVKRLEL
jgi:NAD(P)H-nitrite reductase large subunit